MLDSDDSPLHKPAQGKDFLGLLHKAVRQIAQLHAGLQIPRQRNKRTRTAHAFYIAVHLTSHASRSASGVFYKEYK